MKNLCVLFLLSFLFVGQDAFAQQKAKSIKLLQTFNNVRDSIAKKYSQEKYMAIRKCEEHSEYRLVFIKGNWLGYYTENLEDCQFCPNSYAPDSVGVLRRTKFMTKLVVFDANLLAQKLLSLDIENIKQYNSNELQRKFNRKKFGWFSREHEVITGSSHDCDFSIILNIKKRKYVTYRWSLTMGDELQFIYSIKVFKEVSDFLYDYHEQHIK